MKCKKKLSLGFALETLCFKFVRDWKIFGHRGDHKKDSTQSEELIFFNTVLSDVEKWCVQLW